MTTDEMIKICIARLHIYIGIYNSLVDRPYGKEELIAHHNRRINSYIEVLQNLKQAKI